MDKLFIFCVPSDDIIAILRNLYVLLAAGCKTGASAVRPIFLGCHSGTMGLNQWQQYYERARTMRFLSDDARAEIFSTRIMEAYTITNTQQTENDPSVKLLRQLLIDEKKPYARGLEWEQDFRSNNPNIHVRITEADGVIFLLDATDMGQVVMAKLLFEKRWVKKVQHTGLLVITPVGTLKDDQKSLLHYGLNLIPDISSLAFIPDTQRQSFNYLMAAVAIIDFSRQARRGTLQLPNGVRTKFYENYTISDLASGEAKNRLARFLLFAKLMRDLHNGRAKSQLKGWRKRVNYDDNGSTLFTNNEILAFLDLTGNWRYSFRREFILAREETADEIVFSGDRRFQLKTLYRALEKTEPITDSFDSLQKKQRIIDSLVAAAYSFTVFEDDVMPVYKPHVTMPQSIISTDWRQLPCPFSLFLHYRKAFASDNNNMLAERSCCLDMWELFFRLQQDEIQCYFDISELVVKEHNQGHYWDVISTYHEFQDLLHNNVIYIIRQKLTGKIVAYSSSYTGFCLRLDDVFVVKTAGHTFFSTQQQDWSELKNRKVDFKLFLQRYVTLMQGLDPCFVNYVTQSLTSEEINKAQTSDFFSAYTDYRRHVPVQS